MKKIIVILSVFFFCNKGNSQTSNLVKKNFITGADVAVRLYDYLNKKNLPDTETSKILFPSKWKFKIVGITDSNLLILKQWKSRKNPDKNKSNGASASNKKNSNTATANDSTASQNNETARSGFIGTIKKESLRKLDTIAAYTSSKNDDQFFTMTLSDFDTKCDQYFARGLDFTFGVMTIPIKLRARSKKQGSLFEFEEKFNIGVSAGLKYNFNSRKDRSVSLLLNTSISNVRLDSLNTNGFQKELTSSGAFTIATGLVFKQDDFNIGFFLGWDKVPGVSGKNWVHYGKPWVGVGIGFSLFSISANPSATGSNGNAK